MPLDNEVGQDAESAGHSITYQPDSPQRAPFARYVPRAEKRHLGRTTSAMVPAYIHAAGGGIGEVDKEYLRRKLGRKLGKFASRIERASVRIEDLNGPRGGIDKRCQIKVVMSGMSSVVVEARHSRVRAAMNIALSRVERAVRRAVEERRAAARSGRRGGMRR